LARALHKLNSATVKAAQPGKYSDGGGLWIYKRKDGGAQWVLRYTLHGRRHEMGLGAYPLVTLKEARESAEEWRAVVRQGKDAIKERERRRRDAERNMHILRGILSFIRSDNGPEFVAQAVQDWIKAVGAKTAYIEPGSPWENGYCESFNARFRDEFLNGEIFYSLREAQILIEEWRKHYNTKRPHSALGYRPPAPETIVQMDQRPIMH